MQKIKKMALLVFVAAVGLGLVKLGFWQYERGLEKKRLEADFTASLQSDPQYWSSLEATPPSGTLVQFRAVPMRGFEVLLDNQVHQGKVGYHVLLPVKFDSENAAVWVNMGWLAAPRLREERPVLPNWPEKIEIEGILVQPNPTIVLSDSLLETDKKPFRIQSLDLALLAPLIPMQQSKLLVYSHTNKVQYGLINTYKPTNMPSEKHFAYMVQWWGLSLVWLIGVILLWRKTRNNKAPGG